MNSSFFAQRKRKPTTVVIDDEDNQIKDRMNNNAKKKNKKGNFALMSLQYLLVRLVNPNFHKKEMKKITASLLLYIHNIFINYHD